MQIFHAPEMMIILFFFPNYQHPWLVVRFVTSTLGPVNNEFFIQSFNFNDRIKYVKDSAKIPLEGELPQPTSYFLKKMITTVFEYSDILKF